MFSGSLYNKVWYVHNVMSEALERLLLQRFIGEISYKRFVSTLPCLIIGGVNLYFPKFFTSSSIFVLNFNTKIIGKMEKNPPIIWVRTPHSKKVVLYNLPSPLAYSTSPPSHPKHGRAVFLKDML